MAHDRAAARRGRPGTSQARSSGGGRRRTGRAAARARGRHRRRAAVMDGHGSTVVAQPRAPRRPGRDVLPGRLDRRSGEGPRHSGGHGQVTHLLRVAGAPVGPVRAWGHTMSADRTLSCREARQLIGVDVLGLAAPLEGRALRQHTAGCDDCARAWDDVRALPDLMSTVDLEHAARGLPEPRPELLERILADSRVVAASERRRRRRRVLVAAIAGAAAAAAIVIPFAVGVSDKSGSDSAASPVLVASATDPATRTHGQFTVRGLDTGSEVSVELSGVAPGERCQLVITGPGGEHEVAAWW